MEQQNRKTRSLLINPRFQWSLIGYAALIAAIILLAVYGLFSFGFHEFESIGNQAGLPADHVYYQFIKMQEATFLRVIAAIAIVVGIILTVGGLVISHKIAGPIYRMQKELLTMASEKPVQIKNIHFRKGDYFPELSEAFNTLVDHWYKNEK